MNRSEILKVLRDNVSETRFNHCQRVEETALELAPRFGVQPEIVTPAALLHDLCREYKEDLLLQLATNFGIVIDEIEKAEPLLLHGSVAAAIVRSKYEFKDPEIFEAITFHITGAPGVSSLTKLIYVADYLEPGRIFQAARELRDQAWSIDPDLLVLKVNNRTLSYLISHNYLIHPLSIASRNELIRKGFNE